jgi:hypothetical protein
MINDLYRRANKRLKHHPKRRWYFGVRRGEGPLAPTVNIETTADWGKRPVKDINKFRYLCAHK